MGLQPLILFSDHLFSFFAHLPVEPKFFLLATSPIILEHQWDPPFLQALPLCYIKNYGNCPPLKVCGNLFVQGSLGSSFSGTPPFGEAKGSDCLGDRWPASPAGPAIGGPVTRPKNRADWTAGRVESKPHPGNAPSPR